MSFWSKLLGDKVAGVKAQSRPKEAPSLAAPRPGVPSTVAVIPGKLTVTFYAHDSVEGATGNFLTAVTAGYRKHGQSEVVCTLRLPSDDDAITKMQELNRFFGTVHAWARQLQLTTAGGLTQFGERALFERGHSGILYADARPIPGIEIPSGAIVALLVDAAEVRTAVDFGAYRVLMRIGERYRHFPFPLWSDLDRPSVVNERENETVLAKLPRTRAVGASAGKLRQDGFVLAFVHHTGTVEVTPKWEREMAITLADTHEHSIRAEVHGGPHLCRVDQ